MSATFNISKTLTPQTYTGESNTAVTALGRRTLLFDMVVDKLSTGRLYDATAVRGSVVRGALADCDALGHRWVSVSGSACYVVSGRRWQSSTMKRAHFGVLRPARTNGQRLVCVGGVDWGVPFVLRSSSVSPSLNEQSYYQYDDKDGCLRVA
jgi:hypothetical protein